LLNDGSLDGEREKHENPTQEDYEVPFDHHCCGGVAQHSRCDIAFG
jgi:hypothetical protein